MACGETGHLHGNVEKGDLLSIARRNFHALGKKFCDGSIERELAAFDHIGEEQGSEDFRDGADFEEGVAVNGRASLARLPYAMISRPQVRL